MKPMVRRNILVAMKGTVEFAKVYYVSHIHLQKEEWTSTSSCQNNPTKPCDFHHPPNINARRVFAATNRTAAAGIESEINSALVAVKSEIIFIIYDIEI